MTKEQYIKMNRGINESGDLPEDFLSKIYDEIKNEEIKLKVTTTGKRPATTGGMKDAMINDKQRELLFNIQMKDVESIARDLMSNAGSLNEEFTTAIHLEHVRPMFQVTSPAELLHRIHCSLESLVALLGGVQCQPAG